MALTLKLRRDTTDLTFQGGAAGLQLMGDGYLAKVAVETPGRLPGTVTETFQIRAAGSSHDNLATFVQALAKFQRQAAEYAAWAEDAFPVWLVAQMTNETTQRQAVVVGIEWEYLSSWFGGGPSAASKLALAVAIERMPYWEAASSANFATGTPSAQVSVGYDPTASADIKGDAPGRMEFTLKNTTAGVTLDRAWIGVRSANKWGSAANLQNIWECEIGTLGTDAAKATDATASDIYGTGSNQKVTVTPGTAGWAKRLSIRMDSVVNVVTYPDLRQQWGLFVWLLRAQVSAGEWEVKLRFGYEGMADGDFIEHPPVALTNTSWDMLQVAVQGLPVRDGHVATAFSTSPAQELYTIVQVWAQRTSGVGTLDIDCLVEIPIDEGYVFITDLMDIDQNEFASFRESELGKTGVAALTTGSKIKGFPPFESTSFRIPPGDVRLFIVAARDATQVITDTVELSGKYFAAYRSLAGAG